MKVLIGALYLDMRGRLGGSVASRNRYGSYLRNYVVPTNPSTTRQELVRTGFSLAIAAWKALSATYRANWETYAASCNFSDRFGTNYKLSGVSIFVRSYCAAVDLGVSPITTAPTVMGLPAQPTFSSVVADVSSVNIVFTHGAVPVWNDTSGNFLSIQLGNATEDGSHTVRQAPYTWKAKTEGNLGTPPADTTIVLTGYPGGLTAGRKIWYRARLFMADGRLSSPLEGSAVFQS